MESLEKSHNVDLESGSGGSSAGVSCSTAVKDGGSSSSDEGDAHSEYSVEVVDLEAGGKNKLVQSCKTERECRICQLSSDVSNQESGRPVELGCSCKDDLAVAHKQCAETWFKIKGNKTCEICGSIARNVAGVGEAELSEDDDVAAHNTSATQSETRNFWQGHRFLNFMLACMVFAFVISWLFHFNVPS